MSAFQTVADPAAPVRIVLVGAGLMGRAWMRTIDESPDAELVGVVAEPSEEYRDGIETP